MADAFAELVKEEVRGEQTVLRLVAVLVYEPILDQMVVLPFSLTEKRARDEGLTAEKLAREVERSLNQTRDMIYMGYIIVPPRPAITFQEQEPGHLFAHGTAIWRKADERNAYPVFWEEQLIPFQPQTDIFAAL